MQLGHVGWEGVSAEQRSYRLVFNTAGEKGGQTVAKWLIKTICIYSRYHKCISWMLLGFGFFFRGTLPTQRLS